MRKATRERERSGRDWQTGEPISEGTVTAPASQPSHSCQSCLLRKKKEGRKGESEEGAEGGREGGERRKEKKRKEGGGKDGGRE